MKQDLKIAIVAAVKGYMDTHKMSLNDVAKKASVNVATVSQVMKPDSDFTYSQGAKTYDISDANFFKLAEFAGYRIEKTYWEVKNTDQTLATIASLQDAKDAGSTGSIIGETGSGKTFTVNLFAAKNPLDCYVVTIGSSDNLSDIIDKLIDVMKINVAAKTKSGKLREIAKHLKGLKAQGYRPQIIFDECEYMRQPALCMIKELYDVLVAYCSLVMVGTDQLLINLDKLRKKNKPGIPQLYRRIKFGIRNLPPIDRSYPLFIADYSAPVKKFLIQNCDNYGELHDAMVTVLREADRTGLPVTVDLIKQVLNLPEAA